MSKSCLFVFALSFLVSSVVGQKPTISVEAKFEGDNVEGPLVYKACQTVVVATLTIRVANTLPTESKLSVTCSRTTYAMDSIKHSNKEVISQTHSIDAQESVILVKHFNFTSNVKAQQKFVGEMRCTAYLKFTDTQGDPDYISVRTQSRRHTYKFIFDIDECILGTHDCHEHAYCTNTDDSFDCECKDGFVGNGVTCHDTDECSDGFETCADNAICTNIPGSYTCACPPGFEGDGTSCDDVDECLKGTDSCDKNADCKNSQGSYTCVCKAGFTEGGVHCQDVNECAASTDPCGKHGKCMNEDGGYTCQCDAGYENEGGVCQDVDECTTGAHTCNINADCVNQEGNYDCVCKLGFEGTDHGCTDRNECDGEHPCHSNAECMNDMGSYKCHCKPGFYGDGVHCSANGITCNFESGDMCGWTAHSNTNEYGWVLERNSHGCTIFSGKAESQVSGDATLTSHTFPAGKYCFKFRYLMQMVKGQRSLDVWIRTSDNALVLDLSEKDSSNMWKQHFITIDVKQEAEILIIEDRVNANEGTLHLDDFVFTKDPCN